MTAQASKGRHKVKKILAVLALAAAAYFGLDVRSLISPDTRVAPGSSDAQDARRPGDVDAQALAAAFAQRRSDVQLQVSGVVTRLLPDDLEGSRHQRFLFKVPSGQTVLVAHNIDLAPRLDTLRTGDQVSVFGEYEWNAKGGVLHWTHRDPGGRHVGGWIKHQGRTYQ